MQRVGSVSEQQLHDRQVAAGAGQRQHRVVIRTRLPVHVRSCSGEHGRTDRQTHRQTDGRTTDRRRTDGKEDKDIIRYRHGVLYSRHFSRNDSLHEAWPNTAARNAVRETVPDIASVNLRCYERRLVAKVARSLT